MGIIAVRDGSTIYYKDWGSGRPIVFSHGWPLCSDSWEAQMFFLASRGFRCIAHDRRGHGRSSQPWDGGRDAVARHDPVVLAAGHDGGHENTYDCIAAFSATDFTEDLKQFDVPTLVIDGDDDQVVPIDAAGRASAKVVTGAKLIVYRGGPHGITDTHEDRLNADLLAFVQS